MPDDDLTLEELSDRTGVEPRTLRSWVSEGLLSPPFKPGRGARYPAGNAERALAVRALKDLHGLSLSDIGRRFMMAGEDQIRAWALEIGPAAAARGSARDYLRRIRAQDAGAGPLPQSAAMRAPATAQGSGEAPRDARRGPPRGDGAAEPAGIERLILHLDDLLDAPAPRRSRGTAWTRISITPDVELSVRGDLEPRERALFEKLADQIRAILSGRPRHD